MIGKNLPKYAMTPGMAAHRIGLSRSTIRRAIESNRLPAWRTPGGHYRIHREDLDRFAMGLGLYPLASFTSSVEIECNTI